MDGLRREGCGEQVQSLRGGATRHVRRPAQVAEGGRTRGRHFRVRRQRPQH